MKIIEEPIVEYKTKYFEITAAKYFSGYKIQLFFNNGVDKIVDFEDFLKKSSHPSIRKYLDIKLFKSYNIIDGNLNWNDYDLIFPLSDLLKGSI